MKKSKDKVAIALGFFDGVHQGHGVLLEKVAQYPGKSVVLTFDSHPGSHFSQEQTPLLTSIEDRKWLINTKYNIDEVVVTEFSSILNLNWYDFVAEYLQKKLSISHVVAGHDFRFGLNGEGNAEKLQEVADTLGMTCEIVPPVTLNDVLISSTHIRTLVQDGKMEEANKFLGHPHVLSNKVQHGNKIGTTVLGFPTVNLSIPEDVLIPRFGVYACRIWVGDRVFHAVTNVGIRPTVTTEQEKSVTVEGFLLDFPDEELYGRTLCVEFYKHLRNEMKFENFDALATQISIDVETTKVFFHDNT